MTRAGRARRAFLLAEALSAVALAVVLGGLLGKLMLDAFYLQRVAAEHSNRMATIDSAMRQIRRDTVAVTSYAPEGAALVLSVAGADGQQHVRWTVAPDVLQRVREDGEDREWRATRLRFAWRIEHGPRGDVLTIDFIETPPPRGSALPNRTYSTAFFLPQANVPLAPRTEGTP